MTRKRRPSPSDACCSNHRFEYYERTIAGLQERLWKEQGRVARVIVVEEGNQQSGPVYRVLQVQSIRSTPEGLEILVT